MILSRQKRVIFKEEDHSYTDSETGSRLKAVTKVKSIIKEPFDAAFVAKQMAKGDLQKEQDILNEWTQKRDRANDLGTTFHYVMQHAIPYLKGSPKDLISYMDNAFLQNHLPIPMKTPAIDFLMSIRWYAEVIPELIVFDEDYGVAGQIDLPLLRQTKKNGVVDIMDYKTNVITYNSIKEKNNTIKHYNRYFLPPFDYMEDCKYNEYAFQLSLYGFIMEKMYQVKIGSLFLVNILPEGNYKLIPVPYMKSEAEVLLEMHNNLKSLPDLTDSVLSTVSHQPINDDTEW